MPALPSSLIELGLNTAPNLCGTAAEDACRVAAPALRWTSRLRHEGGDDQVAAAVCGTAVINTSYGLEAVFADPVTSELKRREGSSDWDLVLRKKGIIGEMRIEGYWQSDTSCHLRLDVSWIDGMHEATAERRAFEEAVAIPIFKAVAQTLTSAKLI